MVFIDTRALRYTKGFNNPCSNLPSEWRKSDLQPPQYLFCEPQESECCISRIALWEGNPLHLLSDGDVPQTETLKLEICVISNIKNEGKTHGIPITYHIFVMYHKEGKVLTFLDVSLRAHSVQVENITALLVELKCSIAPPIEKEQFGTRKK